jgi:hypothetical protein
LKHHLDIFQRKRTTFIGQAMPKHKKQWQDNEKDGPNAKGNGKEFLQYF